MTELIVYLALSTNLSTAPGLAATLGIDSSAERTSSGIPLAGRLRRFKPPPPIVTWFLLSTGEAEAPVESHLRSLVTTLPPERLQALREALPPDIVVEIHVTVFYDGQGGQVEFDPASLEIVERYGATLVLTGHYQEED
jgi:hypothetical protein